MGKYTPPNLVHCGGCRTWQKRPYMAKVWCCPKCGAQLVRTSPMATTPVHREMTKRDRRMKEARDEKTAARDKRLAKGVEADRKAKDERKAGRVQNREGWLARDDPVPVLAGRLDDKWYLVGELAGLIIPLNGGTVISPDMLRKRLRGSGMFDERKSKDGRLWFRSIPSHEVAQKYRTNDKENE